MPSPASSETQSPFELASLARALTDADSRLVVWKGGHDLDMQGDLDCAAPRSARPGLTQAFAEWARAQRMTAVVACEHALGMLILVGCGGSRAERRLLQVDLVDEKLVHALPVWTADDVLLSATISDGVRVTLPGAEGVARLLADRRDELGTALVTADEEGARALSRRLGLRGMLALHHTLAARMALELVLAARAIGSPRPVARAVATDSTRRSCPLLRALASGRTSPGPLESWLASIAPGHEVTALA